jgi:ADP-ribose pyrophosphatase
VCAFCRSKDPPDCHKIPNLASRFSYHPLTLSPESNRPLNPFGRTGLQGRGKLYNWGPNHAADPILSRPSSSHPGELEVIVIQRGDGGKWAFSGGMVDEGEQPQETLKREFSEEALNVREEDKEKAREVHKKVFAGKGELIYHGYIDDPRNTDNAVSAAAVESGG